ncbi:hypothetical protein O9G_003966 [Rozella allomycis CSF55]|uniref:Uncharacterized protein n=1 Tax=Rozella allomycis (strain CSF55) TaxID=988480 RepID=A0A075B3R2_ROZAC|nr:hypothetical protein O9G_003966 [Rozella allomycis CSF55]|eukprot:EPZ35533.1 hypothetical protein O9G_003966 [Rozella allomycis CSF55]
MSTESLAIPNNIYEQLANSNVPIKEKNTDVNWLVIGPPKSGKSSLIQLIVDVKSNNQFNVPLDYTDILERQKELRLKILSMYGN